MAGGLKTPGPSALIIGITFPADRLCGIPWNVCYSITECHCKGGSCDPRTGECQCSDGLTGKQCDKCSRQYEIPVSHGPEILKCERKYYLDSLVFVFIKDREKCVFNFKIRSVTNELKGPIGLFPMSSKCQHILQWLTACIDINITLCTQGAYNPMPAPQSYIHRH